MDLPWFLVTRLVAGRIATPRSNPCLPHVGGRAQNPGLRTLPPADEVYSAQWPVTGAGRGLVEDIGLEPERAHSRDTILENKYVGQKLIRRSGKGGNQDHGRATPTAQVVGHVEHHLELVRGTLPNGSPEIVFVLGDRCRYA